MFAHTILTATNPGGVFRFCIHPDQIEAFPDGEPLKGDIVWEFMNNQKDAQGMHVSGKKNLRFIFDPPTGNFKISNDRQEILSGLVQTGKFNPPVLILKSKPEDLLYGFGAASGKATRNNQSFRLLNMDTLFYSIPGGVYASFPFFIRRRRGKFLGIFINSSYPADVNIDNSENSTTGPAVIFDFQNSRVNVPIDVFVFDGTLPEILDNYTNITGRPFFPPLWSLGYHQSRWSYRTRKRVLELAERFREEDIPCDVIHLDIHYMDQYRVFTWHPTRFFRPAEMHHRLNKLGFRTVVIVDPGVHVQEGYFVYDQGKRNDYFCKTSSGQIFIGKVWPGKTAFPDFSKNDVREWWADKHGTLFQEGVSGIWNDMNEPVLRMGRPDKPLESDIQHESGSHNKIRNLYAYLEAQATFLAFDRHAPAKRPFILTRSGFCGIQKYAALWTGDNHSTWEHLRENLNMVINLGLTGVPLCGADVGGFSSGPGLTGVFKFFHKKELFSRWIELGSLMPFFRAHTVLYSSDQEPWSFGDEVLSLVRKHIRRRYRLLPYIYNLLRLSTRTGAPVVRPIFYNYPDFPIEKECDGFMLGTDLLAFPVLEEGQTTREVYLPPGNWYEYETGRSYRGSNVYELDTEPGSYPLFVRAGAILPVCGARQNAQLSISAGIALEIYPEDKMKGALYLDDGVSRQYEQGHFFQQEYSALKDDTENIMLSIQTLSGKYSPTEQELTFRLPTSYQIMSIRGKREEGRILDLESEDRSNRMCGFRVPHDTTRVEFHYHKPRPLNGNH